MLAGDICEQHGRKTIAPQHLNLAIRSDPELAKLMVSSTISQGGMLPNVSTFLFPPKAKKGGKQADASQPV